MDFLNLPKIDLHCHLDGSLRPGSVLELLRKYIIDLGINETNIDDALKIRDHCDSLLTYLKKFYIPLKNMQDKEDL